LLRNDLGAALVAVIIFSLILSFLTAGFFTLGEFHVASVQGRVDDTQAFYYAEGGAAWGLSQTRRIFGSYLNEQLYNSDPVQVESDMEAYYGTGTTEGVASFLADYIGAMFDSYQIEGSPPDTLIGNGAIPVATITDLASVCDPLVFTFTAAEPIRKNPGTDVYIVPFSCIIEATGRCGDYSRKVTLTYPALEMEVKRGSFARYSVFLDLHTGTGGSDRWFQPYHKFIGPVHTNNYFNFRNSPTFYQPKPRLSYPGKDFSGRVTQCNKEAQFWNGGSNIFLDADKNRDIDVPTFKDGCYRNHPLVDLPDPAQGAAWHTRAALGLAAGDPIPALADGVYVPINNGIEKLVIGGIYVKGNSSITLVGTAFPAQATYTINMTQVNTIKVHYPTNTTEVHLKEPEVIDDTYVGVPNGMIYNDGTILGLSGTVQKDSQVTLAADSIRITDHILYQQHTNFTYYAGGGMQPNAEGFTNILGLVAWDGNVIVDQAAPDNLEIHAIIMAPQGSFRVPGYESGAARGKLTLLGGCITKYYKICGTGVWDGGNYYLGTGYERNFIYDIRVQLGMEPPFFPKVETFSATTKDSVNNMSLYAAKPRWDSP
jgi:hypothetical protein